MTTLTRRQIRFLRTKAHPLQPIIHVGHAGPTEALRAETDRALTDHELIKVKVHGAQRTQRDLWLDDLARQTGAAVVQRIGHVATLYRARDTLPRLVLPDSVPDAAAAQP
jgi:RNA-binding protein